MDRESEFYQEIFRAQVEEKKIFIGFNFNWVSMLLKCFLDP
jgi:hypothetical protein